MPTLGNEFLFFLHLKYTNLLIIMKRVCGKSRTEKNILYISRIHLKIFSKSMNSHIYQMNFLDMSQGHAPDSLVKYIIQQQRANRTSAI